MTQADPTTTTATPNPIDAATTPNVAPAASPPSSAPPVLPTPPADKADISAMAIHLQSVDDVYQAATGDSDGEDTKLAAEQAVDAAKHAAKDAAHNAYVADAKAMIAALQERIDAA